MNELARLSINQATVKHADLKTALNVTASAGVPAIGLWREPVHEMGLRAAARMLADSGLRFSSLCRGGFLTATEESARRAVIDDNRRAIEETATLAASGAAGSAAVLVLVVGGLPCGSRDLAGARRRVQDSLAELIPEAAAAGVRLAIEALHPMYCADRAVISTLGQALDMAAGFDRTVSVVVDTFHVWWDPDVLTQIERAGREDRIATYQVCDWKVPLDADVLLSRHYPGDGVIDFGPLTQAVEATGYAGDIEVEIFNADVWQQDPSTAVQQAASGFARAVAPHLSSPRLETEL